MEDLLVQKKRSENMSKILSKNTRPEIIIRTWLHKNGYRFRLHKKDLPGKPDIVLAKYKTVIFINGCFWHCHQGCRKAVLPKTNQEYWIPKLKKNIERFERDKKALEMAGWTVLVIWECETKKEEIYGLLLKESLKGDQNDI
jgi:DNA mismatch endonuclease (patch repair protein)